MSEMHLTAAEQAQFDAMRADTDVPEAVPPAAPAADPAAPSPDSTAPDQQQIAQAEPAPKMVPLGALHEAREQLKQERERMRLLEERTNILLQRFNQQPQPAPQPTVPAEPEKPQIPDLATDPVGHIISTQQYLQQQQSEMQRNIQAEQQRVQQELNQQRLAGAIVQQAQAMEQQFTIEHPDYADAVKHLMSHRHRELEAVGVTDPGRRQMMLQAQGLQLAAEHLAAGLNPAEAIYKLAKVTGFGVQQAPQQQEAIAASQDPGQAPATAARLQNIAAGQQQSLSLGNVRGSGPAPLTAQRLLQMSNDEFYKLRDDPAAKALMGA